MKIIFFSCLCIVIILTNNHKLMAQSLGTTSDSYNLRFADGTLAKEIDHPDIEGTPYLSDEWHLGVVKLADGRTYKDVMLKFNEVSNVLNFKNDKGDVLNFVTPVSEFSLKTGTHSASFKNGYNIIGYPLGTFFEVLSDGAALLLKINHKYISESTGMDHSTKIRKYEYSEKYFLILSGQVSLLKRDKKSILALLNNKQAELEIYIKANKPDLKNDEDLAKLITFYNSI